MGYWVRNIDGKEIKVEDNLDIDEAFYFCCDQQEFCNNCPYRESADCAYDCLRECSTSADVFKKFGYKYAEDDEPESESESNPDWPPICNYIGIPPETNFRFNNRTYRISLNGYIHNGGSIVTNIDLYGILNHPDKIIILAPLSDDDKAMVQQLYNAFGNAKIHKTAEPSGNFSIWLTLGNGTNVQISNGYFKSLEPGKNFYLADLCEQIDRDD